MGGETREGGLTLNISGSLILASKTTLVVYVLLITRSCILQQTKIGKNTCMFTSSLIEKQKNKDKKQNYLEWPISTPAQNKEYLLHSSNLGGKQETDGFSKALPKVNSVRALSYCMYPFSGADVSLMTGSLATPLNWI